MKVFLSVLISLFYINSFAQNPLTYLVNLPIESVKKKDIETTTKQWLQEQNISVIKKEKDTLLAYGEMNFSNTIVYKDSKTYNRVYREQSNGKIVFKIKLFKNNNLIQAELSHFKHQPNMKFDNLNFGIITNKSSAPKQISEMTSEEYANEVWSLMKEQIDTYVRKMEVRSKELVSTD